MPEFSFSGGRVGTASAGLGGYSVAPAVNATAVPHIGTFTYSENLNVQFGYSLTGEVTGVKFSNPMGSPQAGRVNFTDLDGKSHVITIREGGFIQRGDNLPAIPPDLGKGVPPNRGDLPMCSPFAMLGDPEMCVLSEMSQAMISDAQALATLMSDLSNIDVSLAMASRGPIEAMALPSSGVVGFTEGGPHPAFGYTGFNTTNVGQAAKGPSQTINIDDNGDPSSGGTGTVGSPGQTGGTGTGATTSDAQS